MTPIREVFHKNKSLAYAQKIEHAYMMIAYVQLDDAIKAFNESKQKKKLKLMKRHLCS